MTLELRNVRKVFPASPGAHAAVRDVSIAFEKGRLHALLGPSGCGKTTLLRLIAGFEQPTAGEILYQGRSLNGVPPYARPFPMVFQSYALFPHLSVEQNVAYGLRVRKLSRQQAAQRVEAALALLGLGAERHRRPGQLSGGQQQRVALARCLVLEPEVILLDEPLSSLDAELRIEMRREIRALQRKLGITAVYVTHDQEEAMSIADSIVVMNRGSIEQVGRPADVYRAPRSEFVARFMGFPNIFPVTRDDGAAHVLGQRIADDRVGAGMVKAVIRSDAVGITPKVRAGEVDDGAHAVVEEAAFLGGRTEYLLRLADGSRLRVQSPPARTGERELNSGETVSVTLIPARLHFLGGGGSSDAADG